MPIRIHTLFTNLIQPCLALVLCTLLFCCQQKDNSAAQKKQVQKSPQPLLTITGLNVVNATISAAINSTKHAAPLLGGSDGTIIYKAENQWYASTTTGITETIKHFCATENGDQVLVVGSDGLLAISLDKGKTWEKFSSPAASETLLNCSHIDKDKRWLISSEGGAIFYSENARDNWHAAESPDPLTQFYSLRNSSLLLATGPELVAQSDDGGKHWRKLLSTPGATATGLSDTGDTLLITTDRGSVWRTSGLAQWNEIPIQAGSAIAEIEADVTHKTLNIITSLGDIFVSDDGGINWGISFSSGKPLAQLVYDNNNHTLIAVGNGGIFYSDNGGRVWQKSVTDFADEANFLWEAGNELFAFGPGGFMAKSADGGLHWHMQRPAIASFIHQLKQAPDKSLLLTGASGLLLRSTDGGESWQRPEATTSEQDFLFSLLVTSEAQFAAGSPGTILRSTDNGQHWQKVLALGDPNKGYFHKIIGDGKNTLIAISGPGDTYFSSDKGENWQPISINNNQHLLSGVYDAGHKQFIAIGNGGSIFGSSDGQAWQALPSNTTADLQGISLIDERLYASGSHGTVLRSADGGNSWQPLTTNTSLAIQNIVAAKTTLLATGLNGLLIRSQDKGDHWQTIPLPETANLREPVIDKATGIIYIPSRSGNILFSRDEGQTWDKLPQVTQESMKGIYIDDARRTLVGYGARLIRVPLLEH